MIAAPVAAELDRFRDIVTARIGLAFDGGKDEFLAAALRRGQAAARLAAGPYLDRLAAVSGAHAAWRVLAQELTVTETYFFRHAAQLHACRDALLGARDRRLPPWRILSAGCASGEEPYSLAMLFRETAAEVAIEAVDLNPAMLAQAADGHYSPWSLRETPAGMRKRWFRAEGRGFRLDETIQRAVGFTECNLVDGDAECWRRGRFDAVFCRNVLMYFSPAAARTVIARLAQSLRPDGLLFLGHAETLRGLSREFHLRQSHGVFYYQRDTADLPVAAAEPPAIPWDRLPLATDGAGDATAPWFDIIAGATRRIRNIAAEPATSDDAMSAALAAANAGDTALVQAMALLSGEHFAEALAILDSIARQPMQPPPFLLLRGVLLMHRGDLAGAERAGVALLARDAGHAGAHHLMALCREGGGDGGGAAVHDRRAADLDPHFAMPRLHLGLMARRGGDRTAARRELARAAALLPGEEAEHLLLFGGGFGREALLALCQAELTGCGGAP
jgi:chemotaxis protein methyltransferase CheR